MRRTRLLLAAVVIVLAFSCLGHTADSKFSVVDQVGNVVTFDEIPARIVSLAPGNTEILYALGLADNIVGVSTYCDYPQEALEKPKIGGFSDISIEAIVALEPDVVFATGGVQDEAAQRLTQLGIKVITLDATSFNEVLAGIKLAGQVTGRKEIAQHLLTEMKTRVEAVQSAVQPWAMEKPRKVFYEVWYDPPISVGPGSFIHDLIELAGGVNIMADSDSSYPIANLEEIIDTDPDVIIYAHGAMSTAQVADRDGWRQMEAVRTGRVVALEDENILVRPGPRIIEGLEVLAESIYPEAFAQ